MNAAILRRLASLNIDSAAMSEVLSIIADIQSVTDEKRAKDRDRKRARRDNSAEIPRNVQGNSEECPSDGADKVSPSLSPFNPPPTTPPYNPPNPSPSKNARERASRPLAEFETEFWAIYPNRVGKDAARKSWERAISRAPVSEIMAGLRRYVAKTDDRPWCNPATWLNQGRWADEPATSGAQVLPLIHDPPKKEFTDAERAEAVRRWNEFNARQQNA